MVAATALIDLLSTNLGVPHERAAAYTAALGVDDLSVRPERS